MVKDVDRQGRIVLHASWRKKHLRGGKVLLRPKGSILEIVPHEKVDLKADLSDWHGVRRELRKR
ncbi:MAG TPA: AbrB/MazE/SpoVT family DNA-binding domain-containing protein [Thermoplasmata archaeon]